MEKKVELKEKKDEPQSLTNARPFQNMTTSRIQVSSVPVSGTGKTLVNQAGNLQFNFNAIPISPTNPDCNPIGSEVASQYAQYSTD